MPLAFITARTAALVMLSTLISILASHFQAASVNVMLIVIHLLQTDMAARALVFLEKPFHYNVTVISVALVIKFLAAVSLLSIYDSTYTGVLVSRIIDINQKILRCSKGASSSGNGSAGRKAVNSRKVTGNKKPRDNKNDGSAPPPPPPSRPPPPPPNPRKDPNEISKAVVTVFVHVKAVLGHVKRVYKLSRPVKTRSRMEVNHLMLQWLYELRFETHKVAKSVGLSVSHRREPKYLFDYGISEMYGLLEKILKYEDLVRRDIYRCGTESDAEMLERDFREEVVYRPIQELRDAVTLMIGCLKVMREDREERKKAKESAKVEHKEVATLAAPVREPASSLSPATPFRELSPFSPYPRSTATSPASSGRSLGVDQDYSKLLEDHSMHEASFRTAAESFCYEAPSSAEIQQTELFEDITPEKEHPGQLDEHLQPADAADFDKAMITSTPAPWAKLSRKSTTDSPNINQTLAPRPSLPRSPGYSWKFPSDFRERVDALLGNRPLGKWALTVPQAGSDSPKLRLSDPGPSVPSPRDSGSSGSSVGNSKCIIAASQDVDGRAWQIEITVDEHDSSQDESPREGSARRSISISAPIPPEPTSIKEKRKGVIFPKAFSPPSFLGQEGSIRPTSYPNYKVETTTGSPETSEARHSSPQCLLSPPQLLVEEHRRLMDETRQRAVERSMKVFFGRSIKAAVIPGTPDLNPPVSPAVSPATPITPTPAGLVPTSDTGSLKPIHARVNRGSLLRVENKRLSAATGRPKIQVSTTPCPPPRVTVPSAPLRKPQPAPVPIVKVPTARPPLILSNAQQMASKSPPRKSIATAAQRDSIQVRSSSRTQASVAVATKATKRLAVVLGTGTGTGTKATANSVMVTKGRQSVPAANSVGLAVVGSGRQVRRISSVVPGGSSSRTKA